MISRALAVLDAPARDALPDEPVAIRGAMAGWPAMSKWTLPYLESTLGDRPVWVSTASDGVYALDEKTGATKEARVPCSSFLRELQRDDPPSAYLQQVPMARVFPELVADAPTPAHVPPGKLLDQNLWIGPRGSFSPLHVDLRPNLLCQVAGKKRVLLFPPSDTAVLEPFAATTRIAHLSRVRDVTQADPRRFPRVASLEARSIELEPGLMVFIPFGWWHQVLTLETSISVNFWWKPRATQYLSRNALRIVASHALASLRR